MQIKIVHPKLGPQKTRLSSDVAASATSSTVENTNGFATNDYVVFGTLSEELTELVLLTSITANTTLGHTTGPVFAHAARTPIYQIKYNQAKIYTSTSEDGTYTLLTTVDLTPDQEATIYDDTTGLSSTWYKIRYYNETTAGLSGFSVAVQGTGYTEDSRKSMADEVMADFGDEDGDDLKKEQVYRYLRAGVRKVTTEIIKMFPDYRKNYVAKELTSGSASLPDRFLGFVRVDVGNTTASSRSAEYVNEGSLLPNVTYTDLEPKVYIRGSNFYTQPTTLSYAYCWYWDYPEDMSTNSSEHGLPYGARDVLVAYALYRAWLVKDEKKTSYFKTMYEEALSDYLQFVGQSRQMMNRDKVEIKFGLDMYEY